MTTAWIIAFAVLAFFVFFLGLLELGTLRRVADILERAEITPRIDEHPAGGLEPGSSVPPFTGELTGGGRIMREELSGSPYAVLFVSSSCRACETLLRELPTAVGLEARLLVVVNDFTDAPEVSEAAGVIVVRQIQRSIARAFQTTASPHAFVVDAHGKVAGARITNSLADLRHLLAEGLARERSAKRDVALVGSDGAGEHA